MLLAPAALLEVLQFSGVDNFKNHDEILKGLHGVAQELKELFICQWAAYRIHNRSPGGDEESVRPTDEANLRKLIDNARKRSETSFSEDKVNKAIETARRDVHQCLGTDRWLGELPGKEILERFRRNYLPSVQSDTFKEQIMSAMLRAGNLPDEVENLCIFVRSH